MTGQWVSSTVPWLYLLSLACALAIHEAGASEIKHNVPRRTVCFVLSSIGASVLRILTVVGSTISIQRAEDAPPDEVLNSVCLPEGPCDVIADDVMDDADV